MVVAGSLIVLQYLNRGLPHSFHLLDAESDPSNTFIAQEIFLRPAEDIIFKLVFLVESFVTAATLQRILTIS